MELNILQNFLVIAQTGNISKAAQKLFKLVYSEY